MVECEEAALELLVAHEQFSETVEPAMANLNNPAPGLLLRGAPLDCCLRSATDDVRDVAVALDGAQMLGTTVACVGAQVFVSPVVKSSNSGTSNSRHLHSEEWLTLVVEVTALLPKFW